MDSEFLIPTSYLHYHSDCITEHDSFFFFYNYIGVLPLFLEHRPASISSFISSSFVSSFVDQRGEASGSGQHGLTFAVMGLRLPKFFAKIEKHSTWLVKDAKTQEVA
jgi:hypothetical protein